ncbi:MAG: 16S rRNA (cytidine(1402)-2'-O)-methyltransferase [Firmicutes bacterium HGW-Firmicutes-1]|jgi:16S rRNA (cytidine1402-2'-O)-methyltransferase|nr:MAG: 16S rRNA (cytidine(1402)-2'-O)-methyltransferase [Firmicutes bacterium HGW-Firmicutes-1]
MNGKLYLVATPIGNLEDMTLRAIRTLNEVDYIAAEDTRHTIKLLNHFEIKKPLQSYHEHNKTEKGNKIIEDLLNGQQVALVTDAGTPAISDPGEDLVKLCHKNKIEVTSIPGAVALINGLILSGKDTRRFCFEGFLPFNKKERNNVLKGLKIETRTIIVYEAPHKLKGTIDDLFQALGNRNITITRELTKKFEEVLLMTLEEAVCYYKENDPRGEYVLVIDGESQLKLEEEKVEKWLEMTLEEHLNIYMKKDMSKNEAIKTIAKDRNMTRKEVYNYFNRME